MKSVTAIGLPKPDYVISNPGNGLNANQLQEIQRINDKVLSLYGKLEMRLEKLGSGNFKLIISGEINPLHIAYRDTYDYLEKRGVDLAEIEKVDRTFCMWFESKRYTTMLEKLVKEAVIPDLQKVGLTIEEIGQENLRLRTISAG